MKHDHPDKDFPRWARIVISVLATVMLAPIVGSFLLVFALIAGPFLLATVVEQAGAHGDREGRPHQHHHGTPRGRAIPMHA